MINNIISKLKVTYEEEGFDELLQQMSQFAKTNDISQKDAEQLAESFFDIIAGGGDYIDTPVGVFFKYLNDKFPNSKQIEDYFSDICDELENNGICPHCALL
jgi:hypothetical protein